MPWIRPKAHQCRLNRQRARQDLNLRPLAPEADPPEREAALETLGFGAIRRPADRTEKNAIRRDLGSEIALLPTGSDGAGAGAEHVNLRRG